MARGGRRQSGTPQNRRIGRYSLAEPGVDSLGFIIVNLNKKSVTLSIKSEEGREILRKLVKQCDVMEENMAR